MKTNPSATIHISSEAKRALDEALPVLLNLLKHREQAALEPLNTIEWNKRLNAVLHAACKAVVALHASDPERLPWPLVLDARAENLEERELRITENEPSAFYSCFPSPGSEDKKSAKPKNAIPVRVRWFVKEALDHALPLLWSFDPKNRHFSAGEKLSSQQWNEALNVLTVAACDALISYPGEDVEYDGQLMRRVYPHPLVFDARCESEEEKGLRLAMDEAWGVTAQVS